MKKWIAMLLSIFLLTSVLAACGGGTSSSEAASEPASTAEPSEAASEPASEAASDPASEPATDADLPAAEGVDGKSIGICIYKFDDNFMTLYRNELQRYLEAGGASVQVMDGKNDQAEQTNQIQNFITTGVDVLIINLVQSSAAPSVADMCSEATIPVVFINREPEASEEERWTAEGMNCTYVGADARQSGTYQGEIIAEQPEMGDINGDGTVSYVMIQGDPENVDAQYRTEFSIKALEEAGATVNQLDMQRGDWDQPKGQEIAANALTAYGDEIDVIFCNNDAMANGALQAIEAAGRTVGTDIYLVGVDALADTLGYIEEDRFTGTVFNDHFNQAYTAGDMAAKYIAGETVDAVNMVDYVKVTKANVADILALVG